MSSVYRSKHSKKENPFTKQLKNPSKKNDDIRTNERNRKANYKEDLV
ncbi:hypothetical protein [Oceanobacillus sp. Castelsardo]|nr:hypothetical protein [Oceanobacillus sp. Castelsardo]